MPNMTDDQLTEKVQAQLEPIFMTNKAQIWDYALDKNGGDRKAAASEIARTISGESSGKAYSNARRNFEGGRENQLGNTAKWRALGEKFPPTGYKPPKNGVKVNVRGQVKVSGGRKDKKGKKRGNGYAKANFSVVLKGTDALNPTFDALFGDYFTNFDHNPVTDYQVQVSAEAL